MPGPTSILEKLSADDQLKVLGWLELHPTRKVVEMVAQDPPEGLGIKTYVTTLNRFYARHRAETRSEDLELAKLLAQPDAANPLESAAASLASEWAFCIASRPRRNLNGFKALSRWVLKQRELEQREREIKLQTERLALEREKFEFNAARHALDHHAELGEILENPEGDNEDKINAARAVLFNRPVSELPK